MAIVLRKLTVGQVAALGACNWQPNLEYITVHQHMAAREKAWDIFRDDPGGKKPSANPVFANAVCAATIVFRRLAASSQV